jgi:hypothetical protein
VYSVFDRALKTSNRPCSFDAYAPHPPTHTHLFGPPSVQIVPTHYWFDPASNKYKPEGCYPDNWRNVQHVNYYCSRYECERPREHMLIRACRSAAPRHSAQAVDEPRLPSRQVPVPPGLREPPGHLPPPSQRLTGSRRASPPPCPGPRAARARRGQALRAIHPGDHRALPEGLPGLPPEGGREGGRGAASWARAPRAAPGAIFLPLRDPQRPSPLVPRPPRAPRPPPKHKARLIRSPAPAAPAAPRAQAHDLFDDVLITPHLDDATKTMQWRNFLRYDPLERDARGVTYWDAMLGPILRGIQAVYTQPGKRATLALQGEMGGTVFAAPASYQALVGRLRAEYKGPGKLDVALLFNSGFIPGVVTRGPDPAKKPPGEGPKPSDELIASVWGPLKPLDAWPEAARIKAELPAIR